MIKDEKQCVEEYIDIYLKLKEDFDRLKQLDSEGNTKTEEYDLYKNILRKHSIKENIIINNLYRYHMVPNIVNYEDIKILIFCLTQKLQEYTDKLDFIDLSQINIRLTLTILNIFETERIKFDNLEKNKSNNIILKQVYSEEEIKDLNHDDIYDLYLTYDFISNTAYLHTLLFLQREIDNTENEEIRELLIKNKYNEIFTSKYLEKTIIFDGKDSFNLNQLKEKQLLGDKFNVCKRIAGGKLFEIGVNSIFGSHQSNMNEKEREAYLIIEKCSLKSALLFLDEKDIVNLESSIKQSFDFNSFELALEYNREFATINSVFKSRKADKGFSRNLRIVD